MDPISNVDGIVMLLRQRLLERERTKAVARTSQKSSSRPPPARGMDNVQALAAIAGIDDRQLGRALVQGVLADHFGAQLINEAKFQQVVDQVIRTLQGEPEAAQLFSRLLDDLRAAAH